MKVFCPSCGSPLEFRYDDSFVRVCEACHSAIARTDRGIDTLGRFADLAPASSGLTLSQSGRWQGQPLVLEGRAEYSHPAGGSWEEWYLRLGDGRWAWLSHAHGQWAITVRTAPSRALPDFDQAGPGTTLVLGADPGVRLTVGERNTGALASAEGELPFLFVPGTLGRFLDASDDRGRCATVDYGPPGNDEPPTVYLGRRTSLAELGLAAAQAEPSDGLGSAGHAGQRLACPNCGGSIELRVPGRSLSVTCTYCGSLLDCEGPLAILARLGDIDPGHPSLELGAVGRFEGVRYTVTGRLRRLQKFDGGFIEWDEYLLYAAATGYRWLVCVRGHYSFVTPLAPGAVVQRRADSVRYDGVDFRLFDQGRAEVTGVWGELYWKVELGESVATADFIAPPAMLSRESSDTELHWSLGVYQTIDSVRAAFENPSIPNDSSGIAPHQPFRHRHWVGMAVVLAAALVASVILLGVFSRPRQVYVGGFRLGAAAAEDAQPAGSTAATGSRASAPKGGPYVFFTPPFELRARQNTEVTLSLPLTNEWAFVTVDLVHEESGELRSYGAELSYYSGVEGGESWSEGSRENEHLFGAGPAGSHMLRLEVQTPAPPTAQLSVAVAQNVFAAGQLGWALLLLALPGGLLALGHYVFERWRWSESDFAPGHLKASSDD